MEPTLTVDGRLVYSPVLHCPSSEMKNSKLTLKNAKGSKRTETIQWKQGKPYAEESLRVPDFNYFDENGLVYISVRCFSGDESASKELKDFMDSGKLARNAKAIIIDTRSNGGGENSISQTFFENLFGEKPNWPEARYTKASKLSKALGSTRAESTTEFFKGTSLANDIPVIFLTDNEAGSAGEGVMNFAKCYDNVIVVGSHTGGYQLTGNTFNITLPKTGIGGRMAASLRFCYSSENVEGKGYTPDIWCNPSSSLDAVYAMLVNYGLYDDESVKAMKANTDGAEEKLAEKVKAEEKAYIEKAEEMYNHNFRYTVDGTEYCKGTSDYVYLKMEGEVVLKLKAERDPSMTVKDVMLQISDQPEIKPSDRTYRLNSTYGFERKMDMLAKGKTYYVRVIPIYTTKDGRASETQSFTVI